MRFFIAFLMMTFAFAGYAQEDTKVLTLDKENKLIER